MGEPNLERKALQHIQLPTAILNYCHGTSSTTDNSSKPISLSQIVSTQNIVFPTKIGAFIWYLQIRAITNGKMIKQKVHNLANTKEHCNEKLNRTCQLVISILHNFHVRS